MGFTVGDFPQAEAYYEAAISLPMYPDLSEDQLNYIYQSLKEVLN